MHNLFPRGALAEEARGVLEQAGRRQHIGAREPHQREGMHLRRVAGNPGERNLILCLGLMLALDRGPGILEDFLDAVFEPFYRLEGSRNRETGGTGLGLAIARQLALAMDAELSLHTRAGGGLEEGLVLPDWIVLIASSGVGKHRHAL